MMDVSKGQLGPLAQARVEPKPQPVTPPPVPNEPAEANHSLGPQRVAAVAAAGVGVGGLVLGSIFGVIALSRKNDAKEACPDLCNDQADADKWSSAKTAGTVSTIGFIVGAVGLTAEAVLWFTAKHDSNETA